MALKTVLYFAAAMAASMTIPPEMCIRDSTGDFSASGIVVKDPTTGAPFPNDMIPSTSISSVANGFLALYPTPNTGNPNVPAAANYNVNRDESVNSDQFDARIDHYLTSKTVSYTHLDVYKRQLWYW